MTESLTPKEREFLARVRNGRVLPYASRSESEWRQRLKHRGLIAIDGFRPRTWILTDKGMAALTAAHLQKEEEG